MIAVYLYYFALCDTYVLTTPNNALTVTFSPDSRTIVSSGNDQTIKLWDIQTGKCLKTLLGHTSVIRSVAFNPSGRILVSGSEDETIKLWDVQTNKCLKTLKTPKLYQGMNITNVKNLTGVTPATLKELGAVFKVQKGL